jgi:hypothetical protein
MITTGSKFFLAVTGVLGAILSLELLVHLLAPGSYVFGLDTTQAIVMASAAVACAFLGGICLAIRDGESSGSPTALVAARPYVSSSLWPAVTGVAITLMALGLVTDKRIFGLGFVALLCAGFEWVIAGWADRASSDVAHNAAVRGRFLHPIEFPVLGFLIIGSIMFGFSRLMLSLTETGAIIAFAVVGTLILLGAVFMASRSGMSRNAVTGILGLGVSTLVVFAAVGINSGEHRAVENIPEVEKKAANAVADKANTIASVNATAAGLELRHDGEIVEHMIIPRALSTSLLFRNDTGEKAQLVVHSVKVVTDAEGTSKIEDDEFATEYIAEGKAKLLTVRIPKASTEKPYDMVVVTESGKKIATTFEVK